MILKKLLLSFLFLLISVIISAQRDTIFYLSGTLVKIIYPNTTIIGNILVLPGWNFSYNDICTKSSFCSIAIEKGFVLILPDMQKSIYQSDFYAETRLDWKKYKTNNWVTDTLIIYLQEKFELLRTNQKNYLFGISTGGRGTAIIAIKTGTLFKAAASLSGDFDQTIDTNDNLIKGYYGEYKDYRERWEMVDNPYYNADKIKISFYLAHGMKDRVVPYVQTERFYNKLKKIDANTKHVLRIDSIGGHDFNFWESNYEDVLGFFIDEK